MNFFWKYVAKFESYELNSRNNPNFSIFSNCFVVGKISRNFLFSRHSHGLKSRAQWGVKAHIQRLQKCKARWFYKVVWALKILQTNWGLINAHQCNSEKALLGQEIFPDHIWSWKPKLFCNRVQRPLIEFLDKNNFLNTKLRCLEEYVTYIYGKWPLLKIVNSNQGAFYENFFNPVANMLK